MQADTEASVQADASVIGQAGNGMRTVLVTSQKGGAGKTTTALNLAVNAAHAGLRVLMIDLDPQQSLRNWWNRREADDIMMPDEVIGPQDVCHVLPQLAEQFDICVIDTPPATAEWMVDVMREADLILIPIRPSGFDLEAAGDTVALANTAGKPFTFLLNQITPRAKMNQIALRELAQHGRVAKTQIGNRVVYLESVLTGQGAIELDEQQAAAEGKQFMNDFAKLVGLPMAEPKRKKGIK